jgi:Polysaccharide deacetylase
LSSPSAPRPNLAPPSAKPWLGITGLCVAAIATAGCHDPDWATFTWDDRPVLCSQSVDDQTQDPPWQWIDEQMGLAAMQKRVLLLHAHSPGETISRRGIERVLRMAQQHRLPLLTYRQLDPAGKPRAGVALGFDDNAIDHWFSIRDLLNARRAHVTFFVSRWGSRTAGERQELATLAQDGHDVEPHSVGHLHVSEFVQAHGIDGYVAEELLPSMDALVGAGYDVPTIYAYPFGERPEPLDAAVLEHVPRVRVSPGDCPY